MSPSSKLNWMLHHLYELGQPTPEWWSFKRKHRIDLETALPKCGVIAVTLCKAIETVEGEYVFTFDPAGVPSVVVEAMILKCVSDNLDPVPIDLVAWPLHAPEHFATAMGPSDGAALLGAADAFRHKNDSEPIQLFRTPESWLLNGCSGSVILKAEAARWLNTSDAPLVCEDRDHARAVKEILRDSGKSRDIFIPDVRRAA